MDTTSRTAAEYLTALESLGFRSAKWDSKGMRQIERVAGTARIKVCFDTETGHFTVLEFNGQLPVWTADFTAATPLTVVKATVAAALSNLI